MDEKINNILNRGVENIIPDKKSLENLLNSGKILNIYLGIDPTAVKIHIGHAVLLRKLQTFADLGHNVTFLVGDFTALIGDTSDKNSERPSLTSDEIKENFKTYKSQAQKFLDFSKVQIKFNSEWLSKLTFEEIVKLCQNFSVGDFVSRELIRNRLQSGKRVALHEFLYPVMQGYDSLTLDTDIQIGGTDQTFNMQAGRTLLKNIKNKESFVLSHGFLNGTDGQKMSKTSGNAIWIEDAPNDIFGKVMALSDTEIINYFTLATNLTFEEIETKKQNLNDGSNPMDLKKELAWIITRDLYTLEAADEARSHFENTFQKKSPAYTQELKLKENLVETIAQIESIGSITNAKRLIKDGAVDVNDETITDPSYVIKTSDNLKIGKKIFAKVVN